MKFKEYRNLKKSVDKELSTRKSERDSEGRVIINMTVKDDSDFLSHFSENSISVISTDVADFIESNTHSLPPNEKLTLRVHSNCIDDNEQIVYKEAIKEYYAERYLANEKEIRRNYFIALMLLLAGVFVLAVSVFLNEHNIELWSYIVDIAAWVLLWEAADISLLVNRTLSIQRKRYLAYLSMKIQYFKIGCRD